MASIYSGSTGAGAPYPNQFRLDYTITTITGGHKITWDIYPDGGTTGWSQAFWNGVAYYQVGSGGQNFIWGAPMAGVSGTAVQGTRLANGSFEVKHTSAVDLKLLIGGGYYTPTAYAENSATIHLSGTTVAPSGLSLGNITATPDTISATCSLDSWGTPDGSSNSYRELNVSIGGSRDTRRFQKVYGNSKTGTITVTNSSEQLGGMNIVPNTEYFLWMFASNGSASTSTPERGENIVTPVLPMKTVEVTPGTDNVHVSYTLEADGGVYMKRIQCRMDDGEWVTRDVVADYDETSSDFYISDLAPATEYKIELQIMTEAGTTSCGTYTFKTLSSAKFYLPVKEPGASTFTTKKMQKLYVGVKGTNNKITTVKTKKLYGRGPDGKTKLVFSGE